MSEDDDEDDQSAPKGRWLPLNSRRLNANHLLLVAQAVDLPTGLCSDELRQLIDGKLIDMEHEPMNVQVVLQERTRTEVLVLPLDQKANFLTQDTCRKPIINITFQWCVRAPEICKFPTDFLLQGSI